MTTRWIETLVGLFLVLAMFAFIFLSVNVSGLAFGGSQGSYQLRAYFSNVGGLTPRAEVTLSGVTIGSVESISIDAEVQEAVVVMNIFENVDFLPGDSSVSILTAGLLGEKYLGVQLGGDSDNPLTEGDVILETQSAVVLEDLIGRFLVNSGKQ